MYSSHQMKTQTYANRQSLSVANNKQMFDASKLKTNDIGVISDIFLFVPNIGFLEFNQIKTIL